MTGDKLEIKPYNLKELASIYQVSDKTFKRWLDRFRDELGEKYVHTHGIKIISIEDIKNQVFGQNSVI